ncbi:importin-5-like [Tubulanus polymorphus]|uniref:importin-5-like n=1 Tax=Tubulanus polymorphus TaxID=672921 RepID=UPI003DA5BD21
MADDVVMFEQLLHSLLSPDHDVRTPAEEVYDKLPQERRYEFLMKVIADSTRQPAEIRSLAAVLLRRLITVTTDEKWNELDEQAQSFIRDKLLEVVQQESLMSLRKKVCDCVAELARIMIDDDCNNKWPDILKFLFACVNSENADLRESALHIFGAIPSVFGNQQSQNLEVIKQMLYSCLLDQNSINVRFEAVRTVSAFMLANEDDKHVLASFKDFVPTILAIVEQNVAQTEENSLLQCLVELAETVPKFLRPHLESVITLCMKVVSNSSLDDSLRHLALEVIVTMSETAPAMIRKKGQFISQLVPEILAFMVDLEDDPEWSLSDEVEEEDNDSNSMTGESALDRLACGLGGKTMLPHITANIPSMLGHSDWRYRHAGLMAISACGEGCHKQMEGILGDIVGTVIPFLKDVHPRVRYAACNALGQMSTDFGPNFQKKFHAQVVVGLLTVMDDHANPRVQAHAAAALVNFSEDCPKHILGPYLDNIISKLEQVLNLKIQELLQRGSKLVLEQLVTTLASVADTAEEKFINYYDRFMPSLKYIVQNATGDDVRLLRGKTIECISLIGLAVGKEKFMQDCSEVMQLLLKTQTDEADVPEDDPQASYMISAWARMCKILGKEFAQYLPLVMGPVMKAASTKPEVALVDQEDVKAMENDTDWQFVTLGDQQKFGIKTAGLDEKATACQMLVCYARELKEGFADYTGDVVKLMVPLLKFYFHDVVRIAAAESLPYLIECARIKGEQYLAEMWLYICPSLIKAVESEPENDILGEVMHSLAKCIENMGKGGLTDEWMNDVIKVIDKLMTDHFKKQADRQEQRKDEDYDDVLEETLLNEDDEDVYILSKISDLVHALLGTYKETCLPYIQQLMQHFVDLLHPSRPWPDRQWGLCIWDDVVEYAGPHSYKYHNYFLPHLLSSICDKQAEVRQAAAYGVGIMAVNGGPDYAPALAEAVPLLVQVIQHPDSRAVENVNPTENAISAVTKICKYNHGNIDVEQLLPIWLSWLPTWEDTEEAVHIYSYLCDLIESNHPTVLGQENGNLPRLLSIIADAFVNEAIDKSDDTGKRLLNIVRQMGANGAVFQACMDQLNEEQQSVLQIVLTE